MSEQPIIGPEDYHLLDLSNMDAALRPYAERLIDERTANVDEPFNELTSMLDGFANRENLTMDDLEETDTAAVVEAGVYTPNQLGKFVTTLKGITDAEPVSERRHVYKGFGADYIHALEIIDLAPTAVLQELYFDESIPGSANLRAMIAANTDSPVYTRYARNILFRMHDVQNLIDLKYDKDEHLADPLVQDLIDRPDYPEMIFQEMRERYKPVNDAESGERNSEVRNYQNQFLQKVVGLPEAVADDVQFASMGRTSNENGEYNLTRIIQQLDRLSGISTAITAEVMVLLNHKAGIANFDQYTNGMLARIANVLLDDAETVKHIQSGDSTVVLRDSKGDFSNALKDDEYLFDTADARTLMFEINRPNDFYRHMSRLRQRGILPATVVISTHGDTGTVNFGSPNGPSFTIHNGLANKPDGLSVPNHTNLNRLATNYMQPIRDPALGEDNLGRRRIILASCNADVTGNVLRKDPVTGEIYGTTASLATAMAETIGQQGVDIYAGAASIIADRDGENLEFTTGPDDDINKNYPMQMSRLFINQHGQVERALIDALQFEPVFEEDENENER